MVALGRRKISNDTFPHFECGRIARRSHLFPIVEEISFDIYSRPRAVTMRVIRMAPACDSSCTAARARPCAPLYTVVPDGVSGLTSQSMRAHVSCLYVKHRASPHQSPTGGAHSTHNSKRSNVERRRDTCTPRTRWESELLPRP